MNILIPAIIVCALILVILKALFTSILPEIANIVSDYFRALSSAYKSLHNLILGIAISVYAKLFSLFTKTSTIIEPDPNGLSLPQRYSDYSGRVFRVSKGRIVYKDGQVLALDTENPEEQLNKLLTKGNSDHFSTSFTLVRGFINEVKILKKAGLGASIVHVVQRPLCLEYKEQLKLGWDGSIKLPYQP